MATTIILFICFVYFYEGIGPEISVRGHAAWQNPLKSLEEL